MATWQQGIERFNFDLDAFMAQKPSTTGGKIRKGVLYVMECGDYRKIGISANVKNRHAGLQMFNPYDVTLKMTRSFNSFLYAIVAEKAAHKMLAEYAHRQEWFKVDLETAKLAAVTAHQITNKLIKHHAANNRPINPERAKREYEEFLVRHKAFQLENPDYAQFGPQFA